MSEKLEKSNVILEGRMFTETNDCSEELRDDLPVEDINDDENTVIIDPETEELDLNHHRIAKIQDFEPLTKLKKLCLRWNLIRKIENLSTLTTLTELELYDNQITEIENLEALTNLE